MFIPKSFMPEPTMQSFVLAPQNAHLSVEAFLSQAAGGNVAIEDAEGKVVAYVMTPAARDAWLYAEARLDIALHREEILAAMKRRGGVTTQQMLEKAQAKLDERR